MKAAGEHARLCPYDTPAVVEPGDYVRTSTGRTYLVESARVVERRGGPCWSYDPGGVVQVHRWSLDTVVMPADHVVEDDATVHDLVWYRR